MDIVTIKKEMEVRTAQIEQVLEKYLPKEEGQIGRAHV